MRSSKNKPTFTLIECLISLVVLSSIFLSMTLLINQANQVNKYLQRKDQK
ncbi:prepilin-type N-terminal cleavage/methylation domain-containing protein [Enterococcus durans]